MISVYDGDPKSQESGGISGQIRPKFGRNSPETANWVSCTRGKG
jgi:hypothetical protein